ncbi:PrgI family protein, partial [Dysosmobacter welbionis]
FSEKPSGHLPGRGRRQQYPPGPLLRGGHRGIQHPRRQRQRRKGAGAVRHADGLPGRGRGHPVGPAAGGLRRGCDHRSGEGQGRLHRPGAVQEDAGRHRPGGHRVIGRQHRIVPGHGCVRLRPLPVCG